MSKLVKMSIPKESQIRYLLCFSYGSKMKWKANMYKYIKKNTQCLLALA